MSTKEKRTFFNFFFVAALLTTKPRWGWLKALVDCPLNKRTFFCGLAMKTLFIFRKILQKSEARRRKKHFIQFPVYYRNIIFFEF